MLSVLIPSFYCGGSGGGLERVSMMAPGYPGTAVTFRSRQLLVLLFPLCLVFPPWFFRSQPHAFITQPEQCLRVEQSSGGDGCGRRCTFRRHVFLNTCFTFPVLKEM